MSVTINNHYNPCFWTAFWNTSYLNQKRANKKPNKKPREQEIYSLNLKSGKLLPSKTQNVFYQKKANLASINQKEGLDYCKRTSTEMYDNIKSYYEEHPESSYFIDFENHFTAYENLYKDHLENVITKQKIETIEEKTILSFFILIQIIRNHNHLKMAKNYFSINNQAYFEVLLDMRHTLSNSDRLMNLISPFVSSAWKLYKVNNEKFPLSDNPVLIRPFHILLPLAPDLLLEINLKRKVPDNKICSLRKGISFFLYKEFKKRTIKNSSIEIVFGNRDLLEKWQKSKLFKKHQEHIINSDVID
ncbi:MAG: DUF4238 domain-containing protein [Bacteroidetes bacterium]|nr:DUF4238 domain-containing protein [Bacteroidota bacterium]